MNRFTLTFLVVLFCWSLGFSQDEDPVLFTVAGDTPVHVSEFTYIYEKTNGAKADYSEASLKEYLELYKKFKLKVQKAKAMELDTIPTLQKELDGYRKQLANSYLIDKEVTEQLTQQAYDRSLKDVDISHIMGIIEKDTKAADTLMIYNRMQRLKSELDGGADFAELAKKSSDDKTAKDNGGNIGFVNAMLPNGFYEMENAAYTLQPGEHSGVIRTKAGYHIIKVNSVRDARGKIEVEHILIRKPKDKAKKDNSKIRIDSIYQAILSGANFNEMSRQHSQDKASAPKGGNIGKFGINQYDRRFEDAAFALANDRDMTKPVETQVGWHIIRRVSKEKQQEYKIMRGRLQSLIKRDARYEIAKAAMIKRIQKDNNFIQSDKALGQFIRGLDKSFLSYKYKPSAGPVKKVIFTLGDTNYTNVDFENYLEKNSRKRMQLGRNGEIEATAKILYKDFVNTSCLEYEERQLMVKYPEFKSLMREYEEGILLFEATKILVWDRASQDSVGLAQYFDKLKGRGKYLWDERAEVTFYKVPKEHSSKVDKIREMAAKKSPEAIKSKFNKKEKVIITRSETLEKGKNDVLDALGFTAGKLSANEASKRDGSINFLKVEKILLPSEKTLKEARGYIVADYQDYLEKNWVQELAVKYPIEVNEKVLSSLIRK